MERSPKGSRGPRDSSAGQGRTGKTRPPRPLVDPQSAVPLLVVDRQHGRVVSCNTAASVLLGLDSTDVTGLRIDSLLEPERLEHGSDGAPGRYIIRVGAEMRCLIRVDLPGSDDGRPIWLTTLVDVTGDDRREAETKRERNFLKAVVEAVPAAIFVKDTQDGGRYVLCTRTTEDMSNMPNGAVLGATDEDLFSPEYADAFSRSDRQLLSTGTMVVTESAICRHDGSMVVNETRRIILPTEDGPRRYILGITEDISQRREMEMRLARGAMIDALTGLANRTLFRERLRAALKLRKERGGLVVLHSLDLDHFKGVNDTLGHAAGDLLLVEVATRIDAVCGGANTVARLGGDEFAIIQGPIASIEAAEELAAQIARSFTLPIDIGSKTLVIGASHGLAVAPAHGDDPDSLVSSADIALYGAKEQGRGTYRIFDSEMADRVQFRQQLEEDLREAIAARQFELYFQPIVDIRHDRIVRFEALLRWHHPVIGLVPPAQVIPLAEESGIIVQLGEWILHDACRQAATWPDHFGISVNLSSLQVRQPDLAAVVASALAISGLSANRLDLEITESVLLTNNTRDLNTLYRVRDLGVRISLDDFGTGYSSFGTLSAFPFHKIKIDRSFVRDMTARPTALAIVRSIIGLAHELGMTTTAEGVETLEQLEMVRAEGCTEAQGYFFDQPQPQEAVTARMKALAQQHVQAA